MSLQQITQEIIKRVEDASNVPVLVHPDPKLTMLATAKIARGNAPAHLVSYNPAFAGAVDYAICFQCGYILRLFTAAKENQFDLADSYRGKKESERLVTEHLRESGINGLNKDARANVAHQIYSGIIRQLRSVPVGLRVDEWLLAEYPALAEQQIIGATRQLQDNLQVLQPEVKKMAPLKVFDANVAMNAAFAIFWSQRWDDSKLVTPYIATGHHEAGERLVARLQSVAPDSDHDRELIEAWGGDLNLSGWYEFLPVV